VFGRKEKIAGGMGWDGMDWRVNGWEQNRTLIGYSMEMDL